MFKNIIILLIICFLPITVYAGIGGKSRTLVKIVDESGTLISASNPLDVSTTPSVTGLADGVKIITTAGTDEVLASSTICKWVSIQAQTDNTGLIAIGASGVDATVATGTSVVLYPGDVISFEIDNLNNIFVDSTVDGEGVRFFYGT